MLAKRDPYIASAYQRLQIISQDKEKREEYEARERAIWDHNQMMKESREEGREEERQGIIRTMLKTMSPEQIAQILEIPLEYILKVK